jgi:alkylation response protein AidB-like acyl-CoA dehydrogenase
MSFEFKARKGEIFSFMYLGTLDDPEKMTKRELEDWKRTLEQRYPEAESFEQRVAMDTAENCMRSLGLAGLHTEERIRDHWDFGTLLQIVQERIESWDGSDIQRGGAGAKLLEAIAEYFEANRKRPMDGSKGPGSDPAEALN